MEKRHLEGYLDPVNFNTELLKHLERKHNEAVLEVDTLEADYDKRYYNGQRLSDDDSARKSAAWAKQRDAHKELIEFISDMLGQLKSGYWLVANPKATITFDTIIYSPREKQTIEIGGTT